MENVEAIAFIEVETDNDAEDAMDEMEPIAAMEAIEVEGDAQAASNLALSEGGRETMGGASLALREWVGAEVVVVVVQDGSRSGVCVRGTWTVRGGESGGVLADAGHVVGVGVVMSDSEGAAVVVEVSGRGAEDVVDVVVVVR